LNLHLNKPSLFLSSSIKRYSEEDFKLKFWAFVLEEIFGYSSVVLRWGDTVPSSFKGLGTQPKLDLRILSSVTAPLPDACLGEFAGQCTASKMYTDKLKLALIAKLHLNFYTKKLGKDDIFVPFLLIMGFDCQLLGVRLVQPKLYCLEEIGRFSFPVSKKQIEGGIGKMVSLLTFARVNMILRIEEEH
ncbi:hypothetical protein BCV72DRAFT_322932, partial [Rhizopus microsporus var. microsporus]